MHSKFVHNANVYKIIIIMMIIRYAKPTSMFHIKHSKQDKLSRN